MTIPHTYSALITLNTMFNIPIHTQPPSFKVWYILQVFISRSLYTHGFGLNPNNIIYPKSLHCCIYLNTYVHFSVDDIDKTSKDYDEIKNIPRISKIILHVQKVARAKTMISCAISSISNNPKTIQIRVRSTAAIKRENLHTQELNGYQHKYKMGKTKQA